MSLIKKILVITTLGLVSFSAFAERIEALDAGVYRLKSGDKNLCVDEVTMKSDWNKAIVIGKYIYDLKPVAETLPSDLDKNCVFKNKSVRKDVGNRETTLSRIDEEICKDKTVSKTLSTLKISRGEIRVRHHAAGDEPYECLWIKK